MAFSWQKFLRDRNIAYVARGANIGRGEIGIKCPFCGTSDPSEHMAISIEGKGWVCRRNREHRGIAPIRLVMRLIGCSATEAARLTGRANNPSPHPDDSFASAIKSKLHPTSVPAEPSIDFPPEIKRLDQQVRERPIFFSYLRTRGYTEAEASELVYRYKLRGALVGAFQYRLVFPVEHPEGLMTWTGRTITRNALPRYKALSTDPERAKKEKLPPAVRSIGKCLWQAKDLTDAKGELLLICEGPFDALRIDYYGRQYGIRATCLFGKNMSFEQAELVSRLGEFRERALLLDADAIMDGFKFWHRHEFARLSRRKLPLGLKDPAGLRSRDIAAFLDRR